MEDDAQELYLTSGESSDYEDEDEHVPVKPSPEERTLISSSSSFHVLSEMKSTSVLLALIEDTEEKETTKEESKGKTIFFNKPRSSLVKKDEQQKQATKEDTTTITTGKMTPDIENIYDEPYFDETSSNIIKEPPRNSFPTEDYNTPAEDTNICEDFNLGEEMTVPKETRKRIILTLKVVNDIVRKEDTNEEPETASIDPVPFFQLPYTSLSLRKGISLGYIILSLYLLPVLPPICGRDIWLLIKFITSMILLIFSLLNGRYTINWVFPTVSISVAVLMLLYVYTDGCLVCLYKFKKCSSHNDHTTTRKGNCLKLYNQWYEIVRTLVAELLMYPLIVVCLFELIHNGTIDIKKNAIVMVIFIVSSFYLVLAVYIIRPIMIIVTMLRIRKLSDTTNTCYTILLVRFLLHVIGQAIIHVLCLVAVGIKIWEESKPRNSWNEVSPFLWVVIAGGWILPLMGTLSFLAINYYWVQQLSLQAFIDVIVYCERPGFTDAVFSNKTESNQFIQRVSYQSVRQETIRRQGSASISSKIYSPFKVLFIVIYGLIFDTIVLGFIVSLLFGYITESENNKSVVIGVSIFVSVVIILVNIQFLFLFNLWLMVAMVIGIPLLIIWSIKVIKRSLRKNDKGYASIN